MPTPEVSRPADRAERWLYEEPDAPDELIALLADCPPAMVAAVRAQLIAAGEIPAWTPSTERPPPPRELRHGACVGHATPDIWTSADYHERAEAKAICQRCPVQPACLDWSLNLSVHDDPLSIYGGVGAKARIILKRQAQRYLPGSPQAPPRTRCGSCGRQLAGDNLVIVNSTRDGPTRTCRHCRRRATREAARRRRARERASPGITA